MSDKRSVEIQVANPVAVIDRNREALSGKGILGRDFHQALAKTPPYAGHRMVEVLIDSETGAIVEILQPSATRTYEREHVSRDGSRRRVPAPLSDTYPEARLAVIMVSALQADKFIDVVARDEIRPGARAVLRESVLGEGGPSASRLRAA